MWGYIISLCRTLEPVVDIHVLGPSGQTMVTELEIESSLGQVLLSGVCAKCALCYLSGTIVVGSSLQYYHQQVGQSAFSAGCGV